MKKKLLAAIIAAALAVSLLAGCGAQGNTNSSVEQANTEDTGSSTEEANTEDTGSSTEEADAEDTGSSTEEADAEDTGSSTEEADAEDTGSSTGEADAEDTGSSIEEADAEDTNAGTEEADENVTAARGIGSVGGGADLVSTVTSSEFDMEMEKIFDAEGATGIANYLNEHKVDFDLSEFLGRDLRDYYFRFWSEATNEELEEDLSDGYYDDENGFWSGKPSQPTICEHVLNGDFRLNDFPWETIYLVQYIYNSPYVALQPVDLLYLLKDKYPGLVTNYLPDESLGFEFPYDGKTAIGFRGIDTSKTGFEVVTQLNMYLFYAAIPDDKFGEEFSDLSGERAMFGESLMTDGGHEEEQTHGDGIPDGLDLYRDSNGVLQPTYPNLDGSDTTFAVYCVYYIAHDFGAISDENWQKVVDVEAEYGNSLDDVKALLGV